MPKLYTSVSIDDYVDVDVDIEIDEFLDICSTYEKKQLVIALKEEGYWDTNTLGSSNFTDEQWSQALEKLSGLGRLRLTSEEEEIIIKIANKL